MPPKDMPKPPFMHGFILGSNQDISHYAQMMIEDNLSIDHEMMGMEHDMGESGCMKDSECMSMHQMHHQYHMMEMYHEEDKNNDEMIHKHDHEINKKQTAKYSGSNYIIVSIDEILS